MKEEMKEEKAIIKISENEKYQRKYQAKNKHINKSVKQ